MLSIRTKIGCYLHHKDRRSSTRSAGSALELLHPPDAGDGYVDLKSNDGIVHDFVTGETKRYVEPTETQWLMEKARIGPSGTVGRDVGALLKSLYVKNDANGKGLSRTELIEILRESDFNVIRSDTLYADPYEVLKSMEEENPEDMLSLEVWLALFVTKT